MTPTKFILGWVTFILVGWLAVFVLVALASFVVVHAGWGAFAAALGMTAVLVGFVWIAGERG